MPLDPRNRSQSSELREKPCFVLIDLETSGLHPKNHEILEVAGLKVQSGYIIEIFHEFIRPKWPIAPQAQEIHGLTTEFLSVFPDWTKIGPKLAAFMLRWPMVAYNAPFEKRFLTAKGINMDRPVLDLLQRARKELQGQSQNHKLPTVARHYGFETNFHTALNDCVVMWRLAKKWGVL